MREIAFMIIGILLVSLVPAVGGVSSETVSASTRANGLLLALDRLANYTHSVNCTSEQADALREKAWGLYRDGKYNESVKEALKAMNLYHSAITFCRFGGEELTEKTDWISIAKTEVAIAGNVLEYARKLIESGELSGEELRELEAEYNQTLWVYEGLKKSLEENDTQDIVHKVAFLQTSRLKLEEALNLAVRNSVTMKARLMGQAQLRRIDALIKGGANATELLTIRAELENAIKSGNSEEVLRLLKEIPRILVELERRGKIRGITHTTPGHPSFPGSSTEGSPSTPPKKTPGEGSGDKR
ncbi:hypothetical protein [Thermococcus nautili]|uniref:Uncharacterized protein n=1 Tax=Thermococcus nautili TaxID=195522 RepID=W8P0A3_9EURY|nr:hypothetical protein [Thermococcus nautili]AHL22151.1 hypothetical protein BD01_0526 [Thermococcus nautili]